MVLLSSRVFKQFISSGCPSSVLSPSPYPHIFTTGFQVSNMDVFENLADRGLKIEDHGRPVSVDEERSVVFRGHLGVEVGGLVGQYMLLFEYFVSFSGGQVSMSQIVVFFLFLVAPRHFVSGDLQCLPDASKTVL